MRDTAPIRPDALQSQRLGFQSGGHVPDWLANRMPFGRRTTPGTLPGGGAAVPEGAADPLSDPAIAGAAAEGSQKPQWAGGPQNWSLAAGDVAAVLPPGLAKKDADWWTKFGVGGGPGGLGTATPAATPAADAALNPPGPTDTVPAALTPGEGVLNRGAMNLVGRNRLDQLNAAGLGQQPLGAGWKPPGLMQQWMGGTYPGFWGGNTPTRAQPLGMAGGGVVPGAGNIGYVSPEEQDPRWQEVSLSAPGINIAALAKQADKQGISPEQVKGVLDLVNRSGAFGGLSANYARAGSPTPVYGESGYPSAIPVRGYALGGQVSVSEAEMLNRIGPIGRPQHC
jgi:hypothetical protein